MHPRTILSFALGLTLHASSIGCGGDGHSGMGSDDGEAALSRAKVALPLATYELVWSTDSNARRLRRLTLERRGRFSAEMELAQRGGPFARGGARETVTVHGKWRTERDVGSYVERELGERDWLWLEYDDAPPDAYVIYDHFAYEWREPRLELSRRGVEVTMEMRDD